MRVGENTYFFDNLAPICINLQVLQAISGEIISQHLLEELKRLHTMSNPKIQSPVVEDSLTSEGTSDEIEAEANAYFHQMFSGQLTIDAMVQMLARFKESSEKRYICIELHLKSTTFY